MDQSSGNEGFMFFPYKKELRMVPLFFLSRLCKTYQPHPSFTKMRMVLIPCHRVNIRQASFTTKGSETDALDNHWNLACVMDSRPNS